MSESGSQPSWTELMRRGEFAAAWRLSDVALHERAGVPCWGWPRHLQYIWDGRSLAGRRVLVRCYHGLGDTVQFIRFLPQLKEAAAETIVWAQPALLPLLATASGIDRLLPLHDGVPDVAFDADVELMELPHVFRTTLETIPRHVPYLHVAPSSWPQAPENGELAVGVVWRSGDWDVSRSVPARVMARLAKVAGVKLYLLQEASAAAEWPNDTAVRWCPSPVAQLASAIGAMDLVISVDSHPAHLAGALGVPVWTLPPVTADWRWMETRDDTPWYPTMRLWRQERAGTWEPVIARVAAELGSIVGASGRLGETSLPTEKRPALQRAW